jgi:phage-related protein
MTITASGGNREIDCFRERQDGTEVQLFGGSTFTRAALADGRCGFGAQTYRNDNDGCESVGFVNNFRIQDAAGAVLFEDRFRRVQRLAAARYSIPDGSGNFDDGRCLMQAWVGDARSNAGISGVKFADTIARDTATADQVVSGADPGVTDSWTGFMLRQTPAASSAAQRVAATIKRLSQDTNTRTETGVCVRFGLITVAPGNPAIDPRGRLTFGSNELSGWAKTGYAVYVVHDTSATPVWQLEVRHYEGSRDIANRGTLLATADLTSAGLAIDAAFELDVEIRSFDGDTFGVGGFVAIETKVDSTTITPVPESGLTGVIESDDLLIDTRTVATQEGGVGLYHNPDALGAGDLVAFLDFSERAVTSPPIIDPSEQASVTVGSEDASKSGSLTLALGGQISETSVTRPITHRFESGKIQTISSQGQPRRRWSVEAALTKSEWETLVALLSSNGSAVPFDWTHPYTGEALVVRFVDDTVDLGGQVMVGTNVVYTANFTLEEVFAASTYNPRA